MPVLNVHTPENPSEFVGIDDLFGNSLYYFDARSVNGIYYYAFQYPSVT